MNRRFARIRFIAGLSLIALVAVIAFGAAPFLPDPLRPLPEAAWLPPLSRNSEGTLHLLGTDAVGRDLAARLCAGGRISLAIGVFASLASLAIGTIMGSVAAFGGTRADTLVMRTVDVLHGLPFLILVVVLMTLVGNSILILFAALAMVQWLGVARVVRARCLELRTREFHLAARALGGRPLGIWLRHVLPHLSGLLAVYGTLSVPQVILQESFLSFLGLNAAPVSWGLLVAEGGRDMDVAPWLLVAPMTVLAVVLGALQTAGDALRDLLTPEEAGRNS